MVGGRWYAMDLDRREESDFELSDDGDSLSGDRHSAPSPQARHRSNPKVVDKALLTDDFKPSSKWDRLQPFYSDRYVELFQESAVTKLDYFQGSEYETSQIGGVTWEAPEKVRFYEALPRVGRHNLPVLVQHIGTKSELEVKSYLDHLRNAETDRQLFKKQTKNISKSEILAAIEIGPDCDAQLEQAADALAAFQEQYNHAFGQQEISQPFIVDYDVASRLDAKTEESLNADDRSDIDGEVTDSDSHELFNLLTFIELSSNLYMHGSRSTHNYNWRAFAEEGESPAMTQQVILEFHELVVNLVRRLVQTTLFLAQSRHRASTTRHQTPTRVVSEGDVLAALTVLKSKSDLWEYWTKLPRRFGFRVVSGSHRKGDHIKSVLSYDEIEATLAVRRYAGRRRSLSVTSEASTESSAESDEASSIAGEFESASEDTDLEKTVDEIPAHRRDEQRRKGTSSTEEEASTQKATASLRIPPNKRKRLLEEELDQYLEDMDQQARREEEARLLSLLGVEEPNLIKQEPIELGRRPKVPRKSVEEVAIWAPFYQAEWESHSRTLLEDGASDYGNATRTGNEQVIVNP